MDKEVKEFDLQKNEIEKIAWLDIDKALKMYFEGEVESTEFIHTQVPRILQSIFTKRLNAR